MASAIDFYFDFSSPYGYLAATQIDTLAAKYGREVNWHPVLLGAVFKHTGSMPLTSIPMKGTYALRDFARSARFHHIPYRQPQQFPIATQAAARAMLWINATLGKMESVAFAKAIYRSYFVDGIDISDIGHVARIASTIGIDADALIAAIGKYEIKDQLRAEVEQAIAQGVFGSPFMIVDGEPFWGFDRFAQLEAFLKNGAI
jgi:2-hydroxychromene-2-carboxylate isomerase